MLNKNAKRIALYVSFFLFFTSLIAHPVFCATLTVEYLCETGVNFYRAGRFDDALMEFKRALMMDPSNQTAKTYINNIFTQEMPATATEELVFAPIKEEPILQAGITKEPIEKRVREEIIDRTLEGLSKKEGAIEKPAQNEIAGVKITGETQVRLGVTSQDTYWKRANWDLNEKNWRTISSNALNRRENTYDPRIYDRLRLNLDTDKEEGFAFHGNITVDPWSFTGKSEKVNLRGAGGDVAQIELRYWSNTGYTVSENVNTSERGDLISLPEIKVVDSHISTPVQITSTDNNIFTLPEVKIKREFQPVRELWFDYKQENLKLRLYPIAFEDQALSLDDPLRLSNNRIWWEDSPWIRRWKPGVLNSGASPVDFTKGYWDNTWSFFTRDSEGRRLTSLRGFSFEFSPQEETSITTNLATPKDLWQDYSDVDNFLSASRLKQSVTESLDVGLTATTRLGYNLENKDKLDARNYVVGTDLGYEIKDGIKANLEIAYSQSKYDITNSQYRTESSGHAYYFSILGRFPAESIMHTEHDYNGIKPEEYESAFTKFRLFVSRMDDSFDASLSSYVETRDDEFWSRHLHFRKPFEHYYQGAGKLLTWDDVEVFGIGNGIDIGRSTIGFRMESLLWDKAVNNLFDVRNVHGSDGKFIENVGREELSWDINDKLTTKFLGIYHRLPKTHAGTDPYIFDPLSRRYVDNAQVADGKDPTVSTGSLGLEYEFFDWLALNGIWEYTNDISLGLDNFPRGILLNDTTRNFTFFENNNRYRDIKKFLYNQQFFPQPPYPYYNIFKTGLRLNPMEKLEFYLDYTRNPYEKAGQVDDNMNHIGFQAAYLPTSKLGIFFKYTYSRWQDLDSLTQGVTKLFGHHNLFSELVYHRTQDEDFTFQYGEASRDPYMGGILTLGWDPFGGSLRTIDTQHIFRVYYRRKF